MARPLRRGPALAAGFAALAALGTPAAAPAPSSAPGRTPLEDVLQVQVVDGALLAFDAEGGGETREDLRRNEAVLWRRTRGEVAVVATDERLLAVAARSGSWQAARYRRGESPPESAELGDRVALAVTEKRVLGFDGGSGNLIEGDLGPRERVVRTAVGANVAVAVTERRGLGLSPFAGGFFEVDLRSSETIEGLTAGANVATLRTDDRLLTFRAPNGGWGERRRGLGR